MFVCGWEKSSASIQLQKQKWLNIDFGMSRRKKNRTIKRSYIIIESSNEIFNICTPSSRTTNAAHFLPPSTERLIYSFLSISLTISSRIHIVSELLMFPFYKKTFEPKCVECHSNTVQLPLQYRTMHADKQFARLICQFWKFNPLECIDLKSNYSVDFDTFVNVHLAPVEQIQNWINFFQIGPIFDILFSSCW